jgi:hypothetical protein
MEFAVIFAALLLLSIGGAVLKAKMAKSPTFGKECPFCKIRGQIESKEIERDYLGNITKRDESLSSLLESKPRYEEYRRYMVTFLHQCGACSKNWTSSTEQLKEDGLANFSKALGNLVDK